MASNEHGCVQCMAKTYIARCDVLLALFPCVDLDRYDTVFCCDTSMATN
jgi:hypothetical protein